MSMGSIDAVTMAPRTLNAADAQEIGRAHV